jgi:small-conductance mechanosensitive channel
LAAALTDHVVWIDLLKAAPDEVAAIDKALAEAGIEISFPQRDIHSDAEKPLRIELTRPAKGTTRTSARARPLLC